MTASVPRKLELPRGRIFAIGDLHGCAGETGVLLEHLAAAEGLSNDDLVVFIGDYVDRGPDSKGVIEQVIEFRSRFPGTVCLKGNHESMMLSYLEIEEPFGAAYLENGGDKTLASYSAPKFAMADELRALIPPAHLDFLRGLDPYALAPGYVFAHAGVSPIRPLEDQIENDLLWIRAEFIWNIHRFERTVVFGHTPFKDVFFHLPYKIGIDTGLAYGNKLTCVDLTSKLVLQLSPGGRSVETSAFPEADAE